VDCSGYSSSTIGNARGLESASFTSVGAADGNIYIEGVKGEGVSLAGGAERNAYTEGVKREDEKGLFSGRGGTGGTSMSTLFRGGTKIGPRSTAAAATERVAFLDDRDLSPLDVTDPRRDSTVDGGIRGCDWGCDRI
jgi:hypothetical protein